MRYWQSLMYLDLILVIIVGFGNTAAPWVFWLLVGLVPVYAVLDIIDQEVKLTREVLSQANLNAVIDGKDHQ